MPPSFPWILALAATAVAGPTALLWFQRSRRRTTPQPLPTDWALGPRPVFNADERRVYRQLREALPHHVVLSKLPLVRFSQPNDPQQVRYWYNLLGGLNVTFAVCSANGRVLAAIDLETERGTSRRAFQIKQAVLNACRVRYMRCPASHMPTVAELQLLVPHSSSGRGPQAAPSAASGAAGAPLSTAERPPLWRDSGVFQDSFFSPDKRDNPSGFGALGPPVAPVIIRNDGAAGGAVPPVAGNLDGRTRAASTSPAVATPPAAPLRRLPPGRPARPGQPEQPDDIVGIVIDGTLLGPAPRT
jgi:hypothetical protein